jgi:hypothetical protein
MFQTGPNGGTRRDLRSPRARKVVFVTNCPNLKLPCALNAAWRGASIALYKKKVGVGLLRPLGGYDGSWQLGCVGAMWLMHAHVVLVYNTSSRACQNIIQEGRVFRTMRGVAMRMPQEALGVGTRIAGPIE